MAKRCMSNHPHVGPASAAQCDAQLVARVQQDRAARPAQYRPIPEWLNRSLAGKQRPMGVEGN